MDAGNWITVGAVGISTSALFVSLKSARAATRSAATAAESLAHQRQESAERHAAQAEAARPRVRLRIGHVTGTRFRITNYGKATAENLAFVQPPKESRGLDLALTLAWNEGHDFNVLSSDGKSMPTSLKAVWDGQTEPFTLPMPPV